MFKKKLKTFQQTLVEFFEIYQGKNRFGIGISQTGLFYTQLSGKYASV